ncbi:hypothetical protein A3860_36545 [Niastella vici]|uniref:Carbohydrate-binding protein SusD n=2 Tax=Niastella vici TaxID=1703345 RepID=A0A1V9FMW8_9BACT|nr:hypothetical protein A3860_36545 [Niastella vici]
MIVLFSTCLMMGCKKLVESDPPSDSVTDVTVYSSDATAISVLNGIYSTANNFTFQGAGSINVLAGLDADELTLYNGVTSDYTKLGHYRNQLSQIVNKPFSGAENWPFLYSFIFKCNAAIEGLYGSEHLTPAVKQQLLGEAQFFRALNYFYLVNLFGDVPLPITTDPEINTKLARSSREKVYEQIIADLQQAEEKLSADYLNETLLGTSQERTRPTKWAATALLARVYLYTKAWGKAEEKATSVINNKSFFELLPLNSVFLKNSREAIWQLQPTAINFNTVDAQLFIIPQTGPSVFFNPVFLSDTLINSFEPDDLRAKNGNWINTTIYKLTPTLNDTVAYAYKYKLNLPDASITATTGPANMKEYFMMLRLGEQYLIRAEARAQQGNLMGAKEDLNSIRKRAFSPEKPVTVNDKDGLLAAILHERQVELFTEHGHRWLDLKRTGKVDEVMKGITPFKANGAPWQSYQQWYPLPLTIDLQRAPNLVQNEGY